MDAERIPSDRWEVIAVRSGQSGRKVVFRAHIDAKMGNSGALDNTIAFGELIHKLNELLRKHPTYRPSS